jgi:hypothetical protein
MEGDVIFKLKLAVLIACAVVLGASQARAATVYDNAYYAPFGGAVLSARHVQAVLTMEISFQPSSLASRHQRHSTVAALQLKTTARSQQV